MPDSPDWAARHPRIHLVIRGRVQGVGFRWFARRAARSLGLAGWVANQPDGSVRLAAAGPQGQLDQLVTALRAGPPSSRVEALDPDPAAPAGDLPDPFQIR